MAKAPVRQSTAMSQQGDESNVPPNEQKQYDEFVHKGMQLLYSKEGMQQVVQSLQGAGNPVEGLGNVVAMIVMRVEDSAGKAGVQFPDQLVQQAGIELIEQAADLAEQAGVHEFSEEELGDALKVATAIYLQTRQGQGKINPQDYQQDYQALQDADQAGQLEALAPGITEYAQKAAKLQGGSGPAGQPGAMLPPKRGLLG